MGKPKKHNQDAFIVHPYIGGLKSQYIFGVLDGHGQLGHDVSGFIKAIVTNNIEHFLTEYNSDDPDVLSLAMKKGIAATDQALTQSNIDTSFSGTTLTLTLIRDDKVVCANAGDSRAVLGRKNKGEWTAQDLTQDHKPNLPGEIDRIVNAGGRVEPFYGPDLEPLGPDRVWLATEQLPGLAMSRSMGDAVAHSVGVSAEPELTQYELRAEDQFIILASDGIWEFISSEEAVELVGNLIDSDRPDQACDLLVKEASERWAEEDDSTDDITLVIIFLNKKS